MISDLFRREGMSYLESEIVLYVEALENLTHPDFEKVTFQLVYDGEEVDAAYDTVRFTGRKFDLDIDSDNTDGFDLPDRSDYEDRIELNAPGKQALPSEYRDSDNDGILDPFDGYNFDGIPGTNDDSSEGSRFVPIVIELPKSVLGEDSGNDDDPNEEPGSGDYGKVGLAFNYDYYSLDSNGVASGSFRIWAKDSDSRTSIGEVIAPNALYAVDYLKSIADSPTGSEDPFSLTKEFVFYVEVIRKDVDVDLETIKASLFVSKYAIPSPVVTVTIYRAIWSSC